MALRDRLTTGPKKPPNKTCAVCWLSSWIPEEDREAFDLILADASRYPANVAAAELTAEYDAHVGYEGVQRHRRMHMGTDL